MDQKLPIQQTAVSFWLIPAEEHEEYYRHLIHQLSNQVNAAFLNPHVTIYVGQLTEQETTEELIEKATKDLPPFSLKIDKIDYSEIFTKSFYVQFHHSDVLSKLTEKFRAITANPSDYELNPHMSLFYGSLAEQKKQELAQQISIPQQEILFNRVRASLHPKLIQTREEIEDFHILCDRQLIGEQ